MTGVGSEAKMNELEGYRHEIGALDREILAAANRRLELVVAALRGKPVGASPWTTRSKRQRVCARLGRRNPVRGAHRPLNVARLLR